MNIVVIGTRGFPKVQGGVEKHCQELYPRIAALSSAVTVLSRSPYIGKQTYEYKGVVVRPLNCPKEKAFEAIIHSFKALIRAFQIRPDVLHVHAVGPALIVPLARLLGMKVVFTHHGPDYERKKWGRFARYILMAGEMMGVLFANRVVTISGPIAENIKAKYKRTPIIIPNGVNAPDIVEAGEVLKKYGLEKGKYIFALGRFVPEKGFHDLIDAFAAAVGNGRDRSLRLRLVIAGDADHPDRYSEDLKKKAAGHKDVVLTGFISGKPLHELYTNAGLFVIPSYYEGLPIVLLEAMSYGLSCVASDISANRNIDLGDDRFFKPGDVHSLAGKIARFMEKPFSEEDRKKLRDLVVREYNWDHIAERVMGLYRELTRK